MSDEIETTIERTADALKTYFFKWEYGELNMRGVSIMTTGPDKALVDRFVKALTKKYGKDVFVSGLLFGENDYVVFNDVSDDPDE